MGKTNIDISSTFYTRMYPMVTTHGIVEGKGDLVSFKIEANSREYQLGDILHLLVSAL